jgi:MarR family transcriptional regulator for hemolysin
MKQFQAESKSHSGHRGLPDQCAREILKVVPTLTQAIRGEVRRRYKHELSLPQLQSLGLVSFYPDASVSAVAEHLGLSLPSASKIVDALVLRGLLTREASADDRRRVKLRLTEPGRALLNAATNFAQAELAKTISMLPDADLKTITRAMQLLAPAFAKAR